MTGPGKVQQVRLEGVPEAVHRGAHAQVGGAVIDGGGGSGVQIGARGIDAVGGPEFVRRELEVGRGHTNGAAAAVAGDDHAGCVIGPS